MTSHQTNKTIKTLHVDTNIQNYHAETLSSNASNAHEKTPPRFHDGKCQVLTPNGQMPLSKRKKLQERANVAVLPSKLPCCRRNSASPRHFRNHLQQSAEIKRQPWPPLALKSCSPMLFCLSTSGGAGMSSALCFNGDGWD